MLRSLKITLVSILLVITVAMSLLLLNPIGVTKAHTSIPSARGRYLPQDTQARGPYTVQGNTILDGSSHPYLFHGVGRSGLEYSCWGDGHFDPQELSYMGSGTSGSGVTYWNTNTVRLSLSEGFWLRGDSSSSCTASNYQTLVKQTIDALTSMNLNVIIDLHVVDAGGQATGSGGGFQMPDNDSVKFWQQIAVTYASYSNVIFGLYGEPHPQNAKGPLWSCWAKPCTISTDSAVVSTCQCIETFTYHSVGMQALVNAVRNSGATNLVLVAGVDWGFDLSQIANYPITGSNVVYDTHPYPYPEKMPAYWDTAFGNISKTYPVISGESGEFDCGTSYVSQLLQYFDAHQIGWIGWAWIVTGNACGYPELVQNYNGTPEPGMGMYEYQYLQSYLPQPTPTPSPSPTLSPSPSPTITPTPSPGGSPVSKIWYFAEGKVGQGFTEYLTLENPDPNNDCSVSIQYLLTSGNPVTKYVTVLRATRYTETLNSDLNTPPSSTVYKEVSAIVTTTNSNCNGIVAERPMYFTNFLSVSSGSDVVGATSLATSFYFADMPTIPGYSSFITILNPPNSNLAHINVVYYAGGTRVSSVQTTVAPGTRGTIIPPHESLRLSALVTSDQSVVVERPTYFSNIKAGNAGPTSGAASVVGAQTPTTDWLFAEGYTGPGFQENLVLANFGSSSTSATVTLEYHSGHTQTLTVSIPALSQTIVNVNQYYTNPSGNCDTTPCQLSTDVSAEVTAGANIVAEREMFFHYNHTTPSRSLSATGGTDITGKPAPAATIYNFAEGYTNTGYDEWLTLQNPTSNLETINIRLVNGDGNTYSQQYPVDPHSRFTLDITQLTLQYLVQPHDTYLGYEVSMTIQSTTGPFVAERPMYWNTNPHGTQGGSDVIGYTGN